MKTGKTIWSGDIRTNAVLENVLRLWGWLYSKHEG